MDFTKIKSHASKDTINRVKRQLTEWEKKISYEYPGYIKTS